jgi:very-short-patch-repair endonuclease
MIWRQRPRKKLPPPTSGGAKPSSSSTNDPNEPRLGRTNFKRARDLRARATWAEIKLWSAIRRKQIGGFRFRRQFSIGPYFADFVCLPARLVVEVDGGQHSEPGAMAYDAKRTAWFEREEFRVMRFTNHEVLAHLDAVVGKIGEMVQLRVVERGIAPRSSSPPQISGA